MNVQGNLAWARVDTTSGAIALDAVGTAKARTVSGDIKIGDLSVQANLSSVSGNIAVNGHGRPSVVARTVSRNIRSTGVDIEGRSVSGRIQPR